MPTVYLEHIRIRFFKHYTNPIPLQNVIPYDILKKIQILCDTCLRATSDDFFHSLYIKIYIRKLGKETPKEKDLNL